MLDPVQCGWECEIYPATVENSVMTLQNEMQDYYMIQQFHSGSIPKRHEDRVQRDKLYMPIYGSIIHSCRKCRSNPGVSIKG